MSIHGYQTTKLYGLVENLILGAFVPFKVLPLTLIVMTPRKLAPSQLRAMSMTSFTQFLVALNFLMYAGRLLASIVELLRKFVPLFDRPGVHFQKRSEMRPAKVACVEPEAMPLEQKLRQDIAEFDELT